MTKNYCESCGEHVDVCVCPICPKCGTVREYVCNCACSKEERPAVIEHPRILRPCPGCGGVADLLEGESCAKCKGKQRIIEMLEAKLDAEKKRMRTYCVSLERDVGGLVEMANPSPNSVGNMMLRGIMYLTHVNSAAMLREVLEEIKSGKF